MGLRWPVNGQRCAQGPLIKRGKKPFLTKLAITTAFPLLEQSQEFRVFY